MIGVHMSDLELLERLQNTKSTLQQLTNALGRNNDVAKIALWEQVWHSFEDLSSQFKNRNIMIADHCALMAGIAKERASKCH